jgi:hypothetical protein
VFHKSYFVGFADEVPYAVAIVALDEGPRLWTQVIGIANADIRIGTQVEATFDDVTDEVTLIKFRPLESSRPCPRQRRHVSLCRFQLRTYIRCAVTA